MEKVCNADVDNYRLRVNGARADVHMLMCAYDRSVGETRLAYKKVILDKLYKFSKMCGEWYHQMMDAVITAEKHVEETFGGECRPEVIEALKSSYNSFVPLGNEPSERHRSSSQ
jgi:hypothetical protein